MSAQNGRLITCDRCGKQVFLKSTGEGETDGGYTRWNKFESIPEGWDSVQIPNAQRYLSIQVCPDCYKDWQNLMNESFLRHTKYYVVKKRTNEQPILETD